MKRISIFVVLKALECMAAVSGYLLIAWFANWAGPIIGARVEHPWYDFPNFLLGALFILIPFFVLVLAIFIALANWQWSRMVRDWLNGRSKRRGGKP